MNMEAMMNMEKQTNTQEATHMVNKKYTKLNKWNAERIESGLIKSQKAIALWNYRMFGKAYAGYRSPITMYVLVDDDPSAVALWALDKVALNKDIFVRTCPLNPRHGVLESTRCLNTKSSIIDTVTHLQNIMKEHDPEGCLIVQAYQPASASCVLAPNMYVVFGEGHDGVTAGTNYSDAGTSLMLPLSKNNAVFNEALQYMSDNTDTHYDTEKHEVEMVFTDSFDRNVLQEDEGTNRVVTRNWDDEYLTGSTRATLTQIRGCDEHLLVGTPPKGVTINGSIPNGDVMVTEVIVMTGLEQVAWLEENITKELCPDGFVVVEPNGSLLSHINAHCRTHTIPYVVTDEVCVGDTWTEVANGWVVENSDGLFVADPYDPFQYIGAFRDGVTYGNSHWMRKQSALSTFFHQWMGQPNNDPELSAFLGGVFSAWLVKATIGATVGEMRHATRGKKRNYIAPLGVAINSLIGNTPDTLGQLKYGGGVPESRSPYHEWMRDTIVDWEDASSLLTYMHREYKTSWSSAYGGVKWGDGAEKGARVATLIHELMSASDDELQHLAPQLVEAVNALENAQHNNGGLLNKFGSDTMVHFNAGTHGYKEGEMRYAYQSYMIAMDIVNDRIPTNASKCPIDWTEVTTYFSKPATQWRKNPILGRTDAPTHIQETIDVWVGMLAEGHLGDHLLHGNNAHQFGSTSNDSFVPCGGVGCNRCNKHTDWLNETKGNQHTPVEVTHDVFVLGHTDVIPTQVYVESSAVKVAKGDVNFWADVDVADVNTTVVIGNICNHIQDGTYEEVLPVYSELLTKLPVDAFVKVMEAIGIAQEINTQEVKE
jgi:hypothetical protein